MSVISDIRQRGTEKYGDADRSLTESDGVYISGKIAEIRPHTIFEIGTWYGASACVMAKAMKDNGIDGYVYTCDKHNKYIAENEYSGNIRFFNMISSKFLKTLHRCGVKADLVFIDARLMPRDAVTLRKMFNEKARYIVHDYYYDKGRYNYNAIVDSLWHHSLNVRVPSDEDKHAVFTIEEI